MHREMLRQRWEKEELEAMNQPTHYANVQYDGMYSRSVQHMVI